MSSSRTLTPIYLLIPPSWPVAMQASRTIPQAPPLPRPTAPPFWPVAAPCGARPNLAPFPATSSAPRLATRPPRLLTPLYIPETTVPSIPATDGCRREEDTLVSVLNVSVFVFFYLRDLMEHKWPGLLQKRLLISSQDTVFCPNLSARGLFK